MLRASLPSTIHIQEDIDENSADTKSALPTGTERLLIVDDESSILAINQTFLERLGYTVTVTTESFWALEKIRSAPDKFDLVISDQTMPGNEYPPGD